MANRSYGGSYGEENLAKAEAEADVLPKSQVPRPASTFPGKIEQPRKPLRLDPKRIESEADRKAFAVRQLPVDPGWPNAAPAAAVRKRVKDQRRFIHDFRNSGSTAPDAPTAERLVHAGGEFATESFEEQVEIQGEDGKPATQEIKGKRIRLADVPLLMLRDRNLLAPGDKFANALLAQVGRRYFEEWSNAGKHSISAMDFSKPFVNGSQVPSGYFQNEWQRDQFILWTNARESIYSRFQGAVDNLVLYEMDLVSVGRKLHNGPLNIPQCRAVALDRLKAGLENLADHYSKGKNWRRSS